MRFLACWRDKAEQLPIKRCIKEKNDYCRGCVYNWRPAAEFVIDEGMKRVQKNWAKRWKI